VAASSIRSTRPSLLCTDAFDLFSVHLYGDLERIPEYLATARRFMRAHGYLKPVVIGEHAGRQPFEFGAAMAVMQETFAAAFAEVAGSSPAQSTGELAAQAGQDTPERRVMTALYDRMDSLPPRLQMFMADCPAELEAKRERINCRQVVMRTLLALGPLLVLWDHRDPFDGEDEPPANVTWPWPAATATLTDAFGHGWTARCQDGQIRLPLSVTPLFVEPAGFP
jgi:hypothetical protein